jgi:hypothetical protein
VSTDKGQGKADEPQQAQQLEQRHVATSDGETCWMPGALDGFGLEDSWQSDFLFDISTFDHLGAATTSGTARVDNIGHFLQADDI